MNHGSLEKEFQAKCKPTSSIKELRDFVRCHSLPIRDRSKNGLFHKIQAYLIEISKQKTLMQFFKKNKTVSKSRMETPQKIEVVYVKNEYFPFIKAEMKFEEEDWNELKKNIIAEL